ncbi:hypothetical protein HNQ59_001942 [Chitinivorax tropicus]|uniref:Uncharacterized protein n=1 Tax=Chitinivorax tropicus TaxID=714531 RepID=A0A840MTY1_9PROT|nr:hypothetical protein [Chitinivorax tropicus]MBB5018651.1 hypothetical protein [Chitinivorax tropicus]
MTADVWSMIRFWCKRRYLTSARAICALYAESAAHLLLWGYWRGMNRAGVPGSRLPGKPGFDSGSTGLS